MVTSMPRRGRWAGAGSSDGAPGSAAAPSGSGCAGSSVGGGGSAAASSDSRGVGSRPAGSSGSDGGGGSPVTSRGGPGAAGGATTCFESNLAPHSMHRWSEANTRAPHTGHVDSPPGTLTPPVRSSRGGGGGGGGGSTVAPRGTASVPDSSSMLASVQPPSRSDCVICSSEMPRSRARPTNSRPAARRSSSMADPFRRGTSPLQPDSPRCALHHDGPMASITETTRPTSLGPRQRRGARVRRPGALLG